MIAHASRCGIVQTAQPAWDIRPGLARALPGGIRLITGSAGGSAPVLSTRIEALPGLRPERWFSAGARTGWPRYVAGVVALAAAYYGAAKAGQSLQYTASVSAIWPPAGVGIAALYLYGLRWWPGVLIAEIVVNGELLFGASPLPLGSLGGQQAGNMAEILVGAILLRHLIGSRADLDSAQRVGGMVLALAVATAVSAIVGALSMLAGDVVDPSEAPTFLRTWWLGDFAGALVVVPAALVWL